MWLDAIKTSKARDDFYLKWSAWNGLLRKEVLLALRSTVTYLAVGVYVMIYYLLVYVNILGTGRIAFFELTEAYIVMSLFLNILLAAPVVAREERRGTLQWLLSTPLKESTIIVTKYTVIAGVYVVSIVLTMPSYLYISRLGNIPILEWILHYALIILFGLSTLAFGVMCSSAARREITAALLGLAFALIIVFLNGSLSFIPGGWREVIAFLILLPRVEPFLAGIFDVEIVGYYLIYLVICLVVSIYLLKRKRWG
ncbi:hypothetical protein COTS27_01470 [Spirochaetota bacterium]|nr:hypothetical protein COTS27_01470 [Spirochaetota bacterium]